jgi:hypothetical protein
MPTPYEIAIATDQAWMTEIRKAFPYQRAGDVRYTDKANGEPGTPLRAAYEAYVAARDAVDALRSPARMVEEETASQREADALALVEEIAAIDRGRTDNELAGMLVKIVARAREIIG